MTEQSKAFEEWWKKPSSELVGHKATALNAWQASEAYEQARILALLDSEEMKKYLIHQLVETKTGNPIINATTALQAIKQKIGERDGNIP